MAQYVQQFGMPTRAASEPMTRRRSLTFGQTVTAMHAIARWKELNRPSFRSCQSIVLRVCKLTQTHLGQLQEYERAMASWCVRKLPPR